MDLYYAAAKLVLRFYRLILYQRVKVTGLELVPPGPKIIAANHPNASDGFHLPFVLREKLSYLIQSNLFSIPFIGSLLARSGQIPVTPGRGKLALQQATAALFRGRTVVVFPEGRLNPDNANVRAGTGVVRLSLSSGVPIVPVGIHVPPKHTKNVGLNFDGNLTRGRWQVGGCCFLKFGSPWYPPRENHVDTIRRSYWELTAQLMESIRRLAREALLENC